MEYLVYKPYKRKLKTWNNVKDRQREENGRIILCVEIGKKLFVDDETQRVIHEEFVCEDIYMDIATGLFQRSSSYGTKITLGYEPQIVVSYEGSLVIHNDKISGYVEDIMNVLQKTDYSLKVNAMVNGILNEKIEENIKYIYDINIGKAVRASCSYPGVFAPTEFENIKLIDGGIRENTPWKELKNCGAEKVLCVCFETQNKINKEEKNIIDVIASSIEIMGRELANYELIGVDYLLKITTEKISLLDSTKIEYLYNLGYNETKKQIEKIKKLI